MVKLLSSTPIDDAPLASWYFAYGSNLWIDQMRARTGGIGDPHFPPRIAHLANMRLVFQHLEETGPAFANILAPGTGVTGVIFRCSPLDLELLDQHEGGYQRQLVEVTEPLSKTLTAVAYIMRTGQCGKFGRPTDDYLERIIIGAKQHNLPARYISAVIATARTAVLAEDQVI